MFGLKTAEYKRRAQQAEEHGIKLSNQLFIYRRRLRSQENEFPAAKKELVDELLPFVRSLVRSHLDWQSPEIERSHAEAEIRRLLARIDEVSPAPDESPDVLARPEHV